MTKITKVTKSKTAMTPLEKEIVSINKTVNMLIDRTRSQRLSIDNLAIKYKSLLKTFHRTIIINVIIIALLVTGFFV